MTIPALGTPVYDPRLFTHEQEARIAEIVASAVAQALRNAHRQSRRGI
jgi:hypothetical protein